MGERLNGLFIGARIRLRNFWEEFLHEEKGAAEIVAIILIIVVVIVIAAIFKDKIKELVDSVFGKADAFVNAE